MNQPKLKFEHFIRIYYKRIIFDLVMIFIIIPFFAIELGEYLFSIVVPHIDVSWIIDGLYWVILVLTLAFVCDE